MRALLAFPLLLLLTTRAFGQTGTGDEEGIDVLTAQYIAAHLTKGDRVAIDTSNAFLTDSVWTKRRQQNAVRILARELAAEIGSLSAYRSCESENLNTCSLHGIDVVVSISTATISGDSAVVDIRVLRNVGFQSGRTGLVRRYQQLLLRRDGSTWVVVGFLPGSSIS
ncbi:MAG TPA: hypothetical protein VJ867_01535 [Gemmatimonadaceae bacterium]|nr:hypothetical protein [Gemmatimonadaceae bacterium]